MLAGEGIERNARGALELFVRSARRGNAKAMNMVGHFREEGWHGAAKPTAAEFWYRRAAQGGCFRGRYNFARYLAGRGDIDAALPWLRASCAGTPPELCQTPADILLQHHDPRLRAVGHDFAKRAAEQALLP
jgi:TPR repeat protein